MATMNTFELIKNLKNQNPQALVQQFAQQNFPNDPTVQQLLQMGQRGDIKGIEQFAEQFFSQQGKNFGSEFSALMSLLGK